VLGVHDAPGEKTLSASLHERQRGFALAAMAMIAFASNSVLCRLALRSDAIDPAGFTALRLSSGALALSPLLVRARPNAAALRRAWPAALALFVYAVAFSFAYVRLAASIGALVLFGSVQLTMLGGGLVAGQRLSSRQWLGFGLAASGLVLLTLPGARATDLTGCAFMALAGVAWGAYSLRGGRSASPTRDTALNFALTLPLAVLLALLAWPALHANGRGLALTLASGALASALGYIVWYSALPRLLAVEAALIQLSVPVLTGLAGVLVMNETLGARLVIASGAILLGIALARRARG
jgi:drug/metabolite transporter (DMT)-like permease